MKAPACVTLDFETEAIDRRPAYPPRPFMLASQFPGERKGRYDTEPKAIRQRLSQAWASGLPLLFQHAKFDMDVAEVHCGMPMLPWERVLDTEYLLFLHDPHAASLSLKPSAERILGLPPEERDELQEWIIANVPEARRKSSEWGRYICRAPLPLVGKYAVGDLIRTLRLHNKLHPEIVDRGMLEAYERERKLMPIFLDTERVGIRTDMARLERDLPRYEAARERVANWLRKRLGAPGLNLDADRDVGEALDSSGAFTAWTWTKGSKDGKRAPQRSVSKKNMTLEKFNDPQVAQAYGYFVRAGTVLSFFMRPWLELAGANGGWLKPNWNQTRQDRNGGSVGTRSGRPSCDNPNFLNVSKNFENNKGDKYTHPTFIRDLPSLPLMRSYLLPDKDCVWLHRDYNQQELRMLAHFEDGELAKKYCERPYRMPSGEMRFDIHSTMQAGLRRLTGIDINRDKTKIVDFSSVYGKGITGLAEDLGVPYHVAKGILEAKQQLMPGVDHPVTGLAAKVKQRFQQGKSIRTWGGREYFCEKPKYVEKYKRVMTFEYKGLNYLIQPSSADVTKEALVRYDAHPKRESRFLVTVYDENNASSPSLKGLSAKAKRDCLAREMGIMRECMEGIETDVPMLSDGKAGPNWAALVKYWNADEAKEIV